MVVSLMESHRDFTKQILLQVLFLYTVTYYLDKVVHYIEMELYYVQVRCSVFFTTNCNESTYFLDLTGHQNLQISYLLIQQYDQICLQ